MGTIIQNNITTSEREKLASIEEGAQENVQADWNQSDNTQDDYIKNRICYEDISEEIYNQNSDKKTSVTVNGIKYDKYPTILRSDQIVGKPITLEDIPAGERWVVEYGENNVTETENDILIGSGSLNSSMFVIIKNISSQYFSLFNGTGTFIYRGSDNNRGYWFTIESGTLKQLDDKFISDNISRKSDVTAVTNVISEQASVSNKVPSMQEVNEKISRNSSAIITANEQMSTGFQIQSSIFHGQLTTLTCLEDGPWYKNVNGNIVQTACYKNNGEIVSTGNDVFVTENDVATVMNDETLFFFYANSQIYQRVKLGDATKPWGAILLPNGKNVLLTLDLSIARPRLWFYDDSEVAEGYVGTVFMAYTDELHKKKCIVYEYRGCQTLEDIEGKTPEGPYDVTFPTSVYYCSVAQTATSLPVWTLNYHSNDVTFSQEELDVLHSTVNLTKVQSYESHKSDSEIHVTNTDKSAWNSKQDALTDEQLSNISNCLLKGNNLSEIENKQTALNNLTSAGSADEGQILTIGKSGDAKWLNKLDKVGGATTNEVSAHDLRYTGTPDTSTGKIYLPIMRFRMDNSQKKFLLEFTVMQIDNAPAGRYCMRYQFNNMGTDTVFKYMFGYYNGETNYKDVVYKFDTIDGKTYVTFYKKKTYRYDYFIYVIHAISNFGDDEQKYYVLPTFYVGNQVSTLNDYESVVTGYVVHTSNMVEADSILDQKYVEQTSIDYTELNANTLYKFTEVSSFEGTEWSGNYTDSCEGEFTATGDCTASIANAEVYGDVDIETGNKYLFSIKQNICLILKLE